MIVERQAIGIAPDNDEKYFSLLSSVIESTDEYSRLVITKTPREYHFRVVPSQAIYINDLIEAINSLNNALGVIVVFSKSIKSSATLTFIFAYEK